MSAELHLPSYVAGRAVTSDDKIAVHYPWDNSLTGTVARITAAQADDMVRATLQAGPPLTRHQRYEVLMKARDLLAGRAEDFAHLIRRETGLAMRDTLHETSRAQDVLQCSAIEALRDDGQIFSADVSPHGQARKIFTVREPLRCVLGITPFNHPLNQVAHKVAPAIAAGSPILLKPSEKTPLTAVKFAELLYEAGLPGWMLSLFVCDVETVLESLLRDERIELITFTGGTAAGRRVAGLAGYKKLCLELGGCSPLIIWEDADIGLAAKLACEGAFRNSGQRCTSARRILVHQKILQPFTDAFVALTKTYVCGDPADAKTVVGTVISEASARSLEARVHRAISDGAKLMLGGGRHGALLEPTILADVPRATELVCQESFGPIAPILPVTGFDDAVTLANNTNYGLSSAVVTDQMDIALGFVRSIRAGSVNVNQVPAFRTESSPFGGVKDSGLGIKEGVIEAMKFMTNLKTFSLPWPQESQSP